LQVSTILQICYLSHRELELNHHFRLSQVSAFLTNLFSKPKPPFIDENLTVAQIQGPMTKDRIKQLKDTLQQMIAVILDKAQVEKDEGPKALLRILIVEGPKLIWRLISNIFYL